MPAQSTAWRLIDRAGVNDKVEHFTAYAVLAVLPSLGRFWPRRLQAIVVFLFLLGAALELAQLFSPGRTCDWHDLLANSCGIVAGAALASITRRAFRLPSPSPVDSSRHRPGQASIPAIDRRRPARPLAGSPGSCPIHNLKTTL